MNSKRLFYILVSLIVLINISGVGAIYFGSKLLEKQTTKLTELKVESSTLEDVQRSLIKAKKDIDTYTDLEQIAKTIIPHEKDQARTVRELVKIANESNISISSIGFPSSSLGKASTGSTTGGTPAAATASTNTQTQKVEGINNVERLEITVSSDTSKPVLYSDFISFLSKLEQNRRTSQVSSINIQPNTTNRNLVTFSLVLNVYIMK